MSAQRLFLLVILAAATGCQPAIRWHYWWDEQARVDARTNDRLTFIYFRNWYSVECTHFSANVLNQQAVIEATADMFCVQLEFDVPGDRRLANGWGISAVPAFAILDPTGIVLTTGEGEMTAEGVLAAIERAKGRFASASQPAETP